MRVALLVAIVGLLTTLSPGMHAQLPTVDLSPGVPQSLAADRAARVSNLQYDIALTLPAVRTDRIGGRITLTFTLSNPTTPLALDFAPNAMGRVRQVSAA